jgi:hypothetical protein
MEKVAGFIKKNRNTLIGIGAVIIGIYGYKAWKNKQVFNNGIGIAVKDASGQQNIS